MHLITIKNITFQNPENHYVVIKDLNDKVYLGTIFYAYRGQQLLVDSTSVMTGYGEQQKIQTLQYVPPQSEEQLISLLSSGLIPKIGVKTAEKIVESVDYDRFLDHIDDYLPYLKIKDPLKESLKKHLLLYHYFTQSSSIFTQLGFTQESIIKINELFGKDSLHILKKNPYQFYKKIPLLTFKFLDEVAAHYQLSTTSKERLYAGTTACIDEYCEEFKSSGIEFNLLHQKGATFLSIDSSIYYATLDNFLNTKELCEIIIDKQIIISTPQIYYTELGIASNIRRLKTGTIEHYPNINSLPGFLSVEQKAAIKNLLQHKISILTGMPGSGKTTIIKYAVELFNQQHKNNIVYIGTPTGKAAQRVKETASTLSLKISTNHKLLGFLPDGSFVHHEKNLLNVDLLILDESSMIDMFMFYSILKALPSHARLWIIGDSNQLPSVQLGNILLDLIKSKFISHIHLDKVFRQGENSQILSQAITVIQQGQLTLPSNAKDQDFYFFQRDIEKDIAQTTIALFFKILNNKKYSLNELQILCPQKTSLCGVDYLNSQIQSFLFKNQHPIKWKEKEFYMNDKVIQTINDYDRNVFNGDIGFIKSINVNTYQIVVTFDSGDVIYEKSQIEQLELAYAISIHKFQGSECKGIIMPISKNFFRMLTPKLIYTGMTRAKELLVMNGDLNVLNHCILNNKDIERKTFLQHFLS